MFTGLVQDIGVVASIDDVRGDVRIEIETSLDLTKVQEGASICCSGCCLTVVEKAKKSFFVDVSQESLSKTIIGSWRPMSRVNLEPSLKLGDEMGGHIVSGHVDTITQIDSISREGDSHRITVRIPEGYAMFIAPKGSVTIDGVSLTVNDVKADSFDVNIIPHTWQKTTLGDRRAGDMVNIEIDMLARYVARMRDVEKGQA